mgnify:CR=1 FL=1
MKTKIILLLLIGLGDWSEHHFTCAAREHSCFPFPIPMRKSEEKRRRNRPIQRGPRKRTKQTSRDKGREQRRRKNRDFTGFPERAWKERGRRNPIRGSYAAKEGTWGKEGLRCARRTVKGRLSGVFFSGNGTYGASFSKEALIQSLSDFILAFLFNARTRIASYLRRLMTQHWIKIHMKFDSANESVLP